ncbi:unnamed protein product, partial [Leptidea sinapis]
QIFTNRQ